MNAFRVIPGQQLARISHDGLTQFDPARYSLKQAATDYSIEEAKRLKEWPSLEIAVDSKIAEQMQFVAWWQSTVRRPGNPQLSETSDNCLSSADAENLTGMTPQRVSALTVRLTDIEKYRSHLLGAMYFAACLEIPPPRGTQGTGENEWFTPEPYIVLARKVLGEIDLDPASSAKAQKVVGATKFYTEKADGLKPTWNGRVWLNPPYAQPLISHFVSKMVTEYSAKNVTSGIMLTHNYTDTAWFHEAASTAEAICFTRGRVKFYKPDGTVAAPTQGQAFFYFGGKVKSFISVFSDVGFVVSPWKR